jgi:hypothetical protein
LPHDACELERQKDPHDSNTISDTTLRVLCNGSEMGHSVYGLPKWYTR